MRAIPIIGEWYAALIDWLRGQPNYVLTGLLVVYGLFAVWAAFKLPPEAKAALLAWAVLP